MKRIFRGAFKNGFDHSWQLYPVGVLFGLGFDTAALAMIPGIDTAFCRTPEILSDPAYIILNRAGKECSGNFFIDDEVLASEGITDLDKYAVVPGTKEFINDLYVD